MLGGIKGRLALSFIVSVEDSQCILLEAPSSESERPDRFKRFPPIDLAGTPIRRQAEHSRKLHWLCEAVQSGVKKDSIDADETCNHWLQPEPESSNFRVNRVAAFKREEQFCAFKFDNGAGIGQYVLQPVGPP